MSTAKCHACGEVCQILFGNWSLLSLCSKNSIAVYLITQRERRKKKISAIGNRLYIKIM